jgi:hypothetical protein
VRLDDINQYKGRFVADSLPEECIAAEAVLKKVAKFFDDGR